MIRHVWVPARLSLDTFTPNTKHHHLMPAIDTTPHGTTVRHVVASAAHVSGVWERGEGRILSGMASSPDHCVCPCSSHSHEVKHFDVDTLEKQWSVG